MTLVDNRNSTNPYLNLALEEYLIREVDCTQQDLLLLYINEPCIVLGKNQSIYKEVNFEYLRNDRLKLCRRISGGGTVYHDEGNLSFSFISKFEEHKINNYKLFIQPVIDTLLTLGIEAGMDDRNNIICKGKKISGNAQFTNRKNIISHGTLLYDANLSILRSCLRDNEFPIESKAVNSVKSSVRNLHAETGMVKSIEEFRQYLQQKIAGNSVLQLTDTEWATVEKSAAEKFSSFEWIYGRSPLTTIDKGAALLTIEDGLISSVKSNEFNLPELIGCKYQYSEIKKALEKYPNAPQLLKALF